MYVSTQTHGTHVFVVDAATAAEVNRRIATTARLKVRSARRRAGPLVARIADAMLELAGAGQTVDRAALALRGFTLGQLSDRNLAEARDSANARAVRDLAEV